MSIEFRCLKCQKLLRVPDVSAGKMARCPDCGEVQAVPSETTASGAAVSEPVVSPASEPETDSINPFGEKSAGAGETPFGDSANPYAVTTTSPSVTAWQPLPEEYARARLETPAMTLAVLAGIALAFSALGFAGNLFVAIADQNAIRDGLVLQLVGVAVGAAINGTVLVGALQMRKLKNYPLSIAAAILAMLPCSACCIVGIPIGIWALVVLSDRSVRAAFH